MFPVHAEDAGDGVCTQEVYRGPYAAPDQSVVHLGRHHAERGAVRLAPGHASMRDVRLVGAADVHGHGLIIEEFRILLVRYLIQEFEEMSLLGHEFYPSIFLYEKEFDLPNVCSNSKLGRGSGVCFLLPMENNICRRKILYFLRCIFYR